MSTPEPPPPPQEQPGMPPPPLPGDDLRVIAQKRIQRRRAFYGYLGVWAVVAVLLTGVWALSGGGYFWPIWAIGGMGIAALFMALNVFGPNSGPPSETDIEREMRKLQ